jgi:hypothetical protein
MTEVNKCPTCGSLSPEVSLRVYEFHSWKQCTNDWHATPAQEAAPLLEICHVCEKPIESEETRYWNRKLNRASHVDCSTVAEPAPAFMQEAPTARTEMPNFGPVSIDTNAWGHIFIDQDCEDKVMGSRVIMTPQQFDDVCREWKQIRKPAEPAPAQPESQPVIHTEGDDKPLECPTCHSKKESWPERLYKGWGDPCYLRNYYTCKNPWHSKPAIPSGETAPRTEQDWNRVFAERSKFIIKWGDNNGLPNMGDNLRDTFLRFWAYISQNGLLAGG